MTARPTFGKPSPSLVSILFSCRRTFGKPFANFGEPFANRSQINEGLTKSRAISLKPSVAMFSVCHHPEVPASESLVDQQIKREIQRKTAMGAMIRLVLRPLVGVMETAEENPASLHRTAFPHGLPAQQRWSGCFNFGVLPSRGRWTSCSRLSRTSWSSRLRGGPFPTPIPGTPSSRPFALSAPNTSAPTSHAISTPLQHSRWRGRGVSVGGGWGWLLNKRFKEPDLPHATCDANLHLRLHTCVGNILRMPVVGETPSTRCVFAHGHKGGRRSPAQGRRSPSQSRRSTTPATRSLRQ